MTKEETKVQAMEAGIASVIPATSSLQVPGGPALTQASIVTTLNGYLALYQAVDTGKQTLTQAHAALAAQSSEITQYLAQLKAALEASFGKSSPQLARFGLKPAKARTQPTAAAKAIANAKRKATRKARGIIGKVQRSQISATPQPTVVILGPNGQPLNGSSSSPETATPSTTTPAK